MVQMCVNMFKGGKDACGTVNAHMPVTHKFVISNNIIIIIMKIKPSFKETGTSNAARHARFLLCNNTVCW